MSFGNDDHGGLRGTAELARRVLQVDGRAGDRE